MSTSGLGIESFSDKNRINESDYVLRRIGEKIVMLLRRQAEPVANTEIG